MQSVAGPDDSSQSPRPWRFRTIGLPAMLVMLPCFATAQQKTRGLDATLASDGLPLVPERTIRFRVTEGTWMSLDVSPDGGTIVFDLLGHLYTLPIRGGTARQLTSGTAINRQPRFSPDGRQLVFVSD